MQRIVIVGLMLALLSGCQNTSSTNSSTSDNGSAQLSASASASQTPKSKAPKPRALSYSQMLKLFSGKSFSTPSERLEGDADDAWRQAVTYLRDDINRAYRYYPHWTKGGEGHKRLGYSALGKATKGRARNPVIIDGHNLGKPDTICFHDELSRNSNWCSAVVQHEGRYYFTLSPNAPINFSDSYHNLLTPLVQRAVADNNNQLLWALAGDFQKLEPDLKSKYRVANMRVWAENQEAIRAYQASVDADRKAKAEERRRREAAAHRAREAKCMRDTGKPCPVSSGGLIGALLVAGVDAVRNSGKSSASSGGSATGKTCISVTADVTGLDAIAEKLQLSGGPGVIDNSWGGSSQIICRNYAGQIAGQYGYTIRSNFDRVCSGTVRLSGRGDATINIYEDCRVSYVNEY